MKEFSKYDPVITSISSEELLGVSIDSELMTILQDFALDLIKSLVHWLEFLNIWYYQNDV